MLRDSLRKEGKQAQTVFRAMAFKRCESWCPVRDFCSQNRAEKVCNALAEAPPLEVVK